MPIYKRMSENMLLPPTALAEMVRNQRATIYKSQQDSTIRESADLKRTMQEAASKFYEYANSRSNYINARSKFLENAKIGFVSSAIYHVVKEASLVNMSSVDQATLKGLCTQFVREQGAGNLLNRFKYQNTFLAELGKICRNAYDGIVRSLNEDVNFVEPARPDTEAIFAKNRPSQVQPESMNKVLKLDTTVVDNFYDDLSELDSEKASKAIQDRSREAIDQFLNDNLDNRIEVQNIINDTTEKIAATREKLGLEEPTSKPEDPIKIGDNSSGGSEGVDGDQGAAEPGSEDGGFGEEELAGDDIGTDKATDDDEEKNDDTNLKINGSDAGDESTRNQNQEQKEDQAKKEAAYIDPIKRLAQRRIYEMKSSRPKNTYHYLVEALTKEVLKDSNMRARYVTEGAKVDMRGICHTATILYEFLETLNTTQMVDESYIINYLKSMVA